MNVPAFTLDEKLRLIILRTPELELAWSREDGSLRTLSYLDGSSVLGHGPLVSGLDVALSAPDNWLGARSFARYLSHQCVEQDAAIEITLVIGLGLLKLYDRYRVTGTMVARQVSLQNADVEEVRIYGLRMRIPHARVGRVEVCRFEAPGNSARPRIPLDVATEQQRNMRPRRNFAPGLNRDHVFEPVPTRGPGLLALHCPGTDDAHPAETLLCWYYSENETAQPFVEGMRGSTPLQPAAVSLVHETGLAGRLQGETLLSSGTQYLLLLREPWETARTTFQQAWPAIGLPPVESPPTWVRGAALYETHPALHGGFNSLSRKLPELAALGITTLLLLPIWSFSNPSKRLWDGNWSASGSPYAIRDLEQLDPTLGTPADLRNLVQTAHSLDMRVLVDFAVQGCAASSRYVLQHPNWFIRDETGDIATIQIPGTPLRLMDYYSFDWNNPELRNYLHNWALDQMQRYNFDGYRTVAPASTVLNWKPHLPYHASAANLGLLPLLRALRADMRIYKPDAALLCSLAGPLYTPLHDASYDYPSHLMFVHTALNRMSPAELGDYLSDRLLTHPHGSMRICFTEKHDTCDINPLAVGMRGSRISRMLLAGMVICGFIPALWAGQEQEQDHIFTALFQARRTHPVLRCGETLYNAVWCDSPQVFAVMRVLHKDCLLGLLNISPYKQTVTLSLPIDTLPLDNTSFLLHELLSDVCWIEDDQRSWRRSELQHLRLTLEPFRAYCLALEPQ